MHTYLVTVLLHELDLIVLKVRHGDALGLELELTTDCVEWRESSR